jgi:hypothetical protein
VAVANAAAAGGEAEVVKQALRLTMDAGKRDTAAEACARAGQAGNRAERGDCVRSRMSRDVTDPFQVGDRVSGIESPVTSRKFSTWPVSRPGGSCP